VLIRNKGNIMRVYIFDTKLQKECSYQEDLEIALCIDTSSGAMKVIGFVTDDGGKNGLWEHECHLEPNRFEVRFE
jgi:hypothetical protein